MYAPLSLFEFTFSVLLIRNLHDVEFLKLVVIRDHANTADALMCTGSLVKIIASYFR